MKTVTDLPIFTVRKGKSQIEFAQSNSSDSKLADFQDLRAFVSWREVRSVAKNVSRHLGKNAIYLDTLDDYNRLLIFCAVRPITPKHDVDNLIQVVFGLNGYDLSYWSMNFRRAFWSDNNESSLIRMTTAFKHFFGLIE